MKKKTSDKINNSIPIRSLISNLCVWYPIKDSRIKSFHHKNLTNLKNSKEIINDLDLTSKLIHNTVFAIAVKIASETKTGQNDLCTAKKGPKNITLN